MPDSTANANMGGYQDTEAIPDHPTTGNVASFSPPAQDQKDTTADNAPITPADISAALTPDPTKQPAVPPRRKPHTDQDYNRQQLQQLSRELQSRLTPQEMDFLRYYLGIQTPADGRIIQGNKTASMAAAGYKYDNGVGTLSHRADTILLRAQIPLQLLTHTMGASLDTVAQQFVLGINATAKKEHFYEGRIFYGEERPDMTERGKWVDRLLPLYGYGAKRASRGPLYQGADDVDDGDARKLVGPGGLYPGQNP